MNTTAANTFKFKNLYHLCIANNTKFHCRASIFYSFFCFLTFESNLNDNTSLNTGSNKTIVDRLGR